MAKFNPLALKIAFIGIPFLIGVALLPTNSPDSVKPQVTKSELLKTRTWSESPANSSNVAGVNGAPTTFHPGILPSTVINSPQPWRFTGTVERGGARQARMENQATGETVYVGQGEVWLGMRLISASDGAIVVAGANARASGSQPKAGPAPLSGSSERSTGFAVPVFTSPE